jgi:hypothetical protein
MEKNKRVTSGAYRMAGSKQTAPDVSSGMFATCLKFPKVTRCGAIFVSLSPDEGCGAYEWENSSKSHAAQRRPVPFDSRFPIIEAKRLVSVLGGKRT